MKISVADEFKKMLMVFQIFPEFSQRGVLEGYFGEWEGK